MRTSGLKGHGDFAATKKYVKKLKGAKKKAAKRCRYVRVERCVIKASGKGAVPSRGSFLRVEGSYVPATGVAERRPALYVGQGMCVKGSTLYLMLYDYGGKDGKRSCAMKARLPKAGKVGKASDYLFDPLGLNGAWVENEGVAVHGRWLLVVTNEAVDKIRVYER